VNTKGVNVCSGGGSGEQCVLEEGGGEQCVLEEGR
jgi:hypothetical protein